MASNLNVSGAGSSEANGHYTWNSGAGVWEQDSGTCTIDSQGGMMWVLVQNDPGPPYPLYLDAAYPPADYPWLATWSTANGSDPAPTVTEDTGGGGEPLHIRGTLLSGTSGVSGVEVVASHEGLDDCTDTSDENGDYDIAVSLGETTWRVTPDGTSYTWYPTYRDVEVELADVENIDFSTAIAEEAAADLSMSMNLSAAGKAIMGGAAALSMAMDVGAEGRNQVRGAVDLSMVLDLSAEGLDVGTASAALGMALDLSASGRALRFGAAALSMTLDFTPQGEWPQPDPSSDKTYWRRRSQFQAETRRVSKGRSLAWLDGPPATGITLGLFHALEADFETVAAAGFNTVLSAAWPNVLGQTVASVVAASEAAGLLAGVILPDTPETSQIAAYGSHDAVRAWYAQDEPNTKTDWEDRLTTLQGYKDEWDTEKPIMVCCNYASADEYRDRFRAFLAESEIVCHNNYPYRYNLWPRAYTFETPTGLMTNMPIAQDIAEREDREHWVILQAHGQNSTTTGLAMPPAKFLRAQAYASLIQGATGLIWFCMDNAYIRSASLYGVAPSVPQDYGEGGLVISEAQAYWASYAWAAIAAIVADVSRLEDVWLAPTSALDYVITFDEESFTWSKDPICAILKEYEGDYYLFIANIENYPHGVQVILPIEPSVETLLGPTASIEGGTLSVELGAWGVWGGKLTT